MRNYNELSMWVIKILLIILFLTGCKTYSYFSTPNDLLSKDCIVYMVDGTRKSGKLTVQFENGHVADSFIHLYTQQKGDEKIEVKDIQFYQYNGESYFPKKIDMEAYEIPNREKLYLPDTRNLLFVKRITKADDKISLFELFEAREKTTDGFEHYDYFVSFPSDNRLVAWI